LTGCDEGHHIFSDRDEEEQFMARKKQPNPASDAAHVKLPGAALHMAGEHPEVWEAFQHLGEKASRAGPLDARTRRLIHLALAIAAGSEGATHSHARRASPEGISPEELEHVAVLAITTVGWSQAMKGLTWVRDITRPRPGAPASEPLEP
jgi:alkylhydroperoxidase/carboxymuconolactone decarboxylase family protein YurZ